MDDNTKVNIFKIIPGRILYIFQTVRYIRGDVKAIKYFMDNLPNNLSPLECRKLIYDFYKISLNVDCPHTQEEILDYVGSIFRLGEPIQGCLVEAGCYKGGSTAKLSIAAYKNNRKLVVFDSFEGVPNNDELHTKNIFGGLARFRKGDYKGTLEEVRKNVDKYGNLSVCEMIKGWFEDTMPSFREPIAAIFIDCDLVSSTKTCLKYLYPLLQPGGVLYSQDGHLPLVIEVFDDDTFWEQQVGCQKPVIHGLYHNKILKIIKDK
jgi:O-methyltransferase